MSLGLHSVMNNMVIFFEFLLNYQQHKFGISANYFIPFISIVKFIMVTYKFSWKYNLI